MKQLADRVFVETTYPGVNVGAVLTRKGFVCIDAPSYPRDMRDWLKQLHQLDPRPITLAILTDCHGDRVLNTRWFGTALIAHRLCAERIEGFDRRYPQPMLDSLASRNPEAGRELSQSPVERVTVCFSRGLTLFNGDEPLYVEGTPGPRDGASMVRLPNEGVVFSGDLLVAKTHPFLIGARLAEWISHLRKLQTLADEGYVIVPGRGPISEPGAIRQLTDFLAEVQARAALLAEADYTRAELNAVVADLLGCFPLGARPKNWVKSQLRFGLAYQQAELRARTAPTYPSNAIPEGEVRHG